MNPAESASDAKTAPRFLIVTALEGIGAVAADLEKRMGAVVHIAPSRAAALAMLDRKSYAAVVLDQMLAESDAEGAEVIWNRAGLALPLEISFATSSSVRLERELRVALSRLEREQELAREAARAELDIEMKNAVTTFLLEAHLALQESQIPPEIGARLRTLAAAASRMKAQLQESTHSSPNCGIEPGNSPK